MGVGSRGAEDEQRLAGLFQGIGDLEGLAFRETEIETAQAAPHGRVEEEDQQPESGDPGQEAEGGFGSGHGAQNWK
jgi:hypothetical protein